MKKIILVVLAVTSVAFGQVKKQDTIPKIKENTISLLLNVQDGAGIGLSHEGTAKMVKLFKMYQSDVVYFNLISGATLSNGISSIDGTGYEFGFGSRLYFNGKNNKGVYFQNALASGQIKYDDSFVVGNQVFNFKGKYSYFSLINPDLGYKFKIAKVINFDINAGFIWKWEMLRDKGDIDNKMFDNLVPRVGLRVGYIF